MPGQQTIDPRNVSLNVCGVPVLMLAKGSYITVEYDTDFYTDDVGAQGDVVRIRNADRRGTIKFTTMRNSPSNDALSFLAQQDDATGLGTGATLVKDNRGSSLHSAQQSWLKKIPSAQYATEANTVEWEVRCAQLKSFVGGTSFT